MNKYNDHILKRAIYILNIKGNCHTLDPNENCVSCRECSIKFICQNISENLEAYLNSLDNNNPKYDMFNEYRIIFKKELLKKLKLLIYDNWDDQIIKEVAAEVLL